MTQSGQTIHSLHDRDASRIAEYLYDESLGTSSLIREYIWANGGVVGVYENGTLYFVRTDHIMRPVFATNLNGTVAWEASYLPFGGIDASSGPNPTLRFPGQWFQSETGLHQNWIRNYDPTTGRYNQADPLGLVDGASVYGYALQNPGMYTDFMGLSANGPVFPRNNFDNLLHCVSDDDDPCREWFEELMDLYEDLITLGGDHWPSFEAYNEAAKQYNDVCAQSGSGNPRLPLIPLDPNRGSNRNERVPNEDGPWWENIPSVPPIGVPGGRPRKPNPPGGGGNFMPPLNPVLIND